DDDGGRHHGRPGADPVEHRHRLGADAAYRRADDRRHDLVDRSDAGGDPGDLWPGQGLAPAPCGAGRGRPAPTGPGGGSAMPARKCFVVLLVLAFLAVWTAGPALTTPCQMSSAAMSMSGSGIPCKPDALSCRAEMACCQAVPSTPALSGVAWQPADWRQAAY